MMSTRPYALKTMLRAGLYSAALCGLLIASPALAESRDADGSRLQARSIALGSTQRDTLSPPRDNTDWLSFKVPAGANVTISLNHKPETASVQLSLTDARGQSVASSTSQRGAASLRQRLEPGIYYLSISSNTNVSYSVTVQ